MPAILAGLLAGWLIYRATDGATGPLGDILPEVYAVLVFGLVSALALLFTADWRLAPAVLVIEPSASSSHGHAAGHH